MKYKIKTTTTQKDYCGKSLFNNIAKELEFDSSVFDGNSENVIESFLDAELITTGNSVVVSYKESNISGMGQTYTQIKFSTENPCEIYIERTGNVNTSMVFSEGKRHICVYNTEIMPFEVCIFSQSVDNRLLEDGHLEIIYIVEIKGARAHKTIFKMETEKI